VTIKAALQIEKKFLTKTLFSILFQLGPPQRRLAAGPMRSAFPSSASAQLAQARARDTAAVKMRAHIFRGLEAKVSR
jgi:hypothetical protein